MRFGGEAEDKGMVYNTQPLTTNITSINGTVASDTSRTWMGCQVDDGVSSATIVIGSSVASGEVANTSSTAYDATGGYRVLATSGVNGNFAGWNNGGAKGTVPFLARITFVLKTGAAASLLNTRIWAAIADADISGSSNPSTHNVAGFTYATDTDGTAFWRIYTSDTTNVVRQTTQAQVLAATRYVMVFDFLDHVFLINGNATPYNPSNSVNWGNTAKCGWVFGNTTLDTNPKTINLGRVLIDRP